MHCYFSHLFYRRTVAFYLGLQALAVANAFSNKVTSHHKRKPFFTDLNSRILRARGHFERDDNIRNSKSSLFSNTKNNKVDINLSMDKMAHQQSSVPSKFVNATESGEIPSFNGSDKAKATDFANYFCSYAQLYHQKQMLADHNRMAAYHAAIMGNASIFKDKVVMDVGTGSGILAVWAAQAGARRVYAGKLCATVWYKILQ